MRNGFLLALAATLLLAPTARAAGGCPQGASCGKVTVPLDHTGGTPGTLQIAYTRVPATGTRTGTLVLLAGGPGQAAIPFTDSFSVLLKDLRPSYDIVYVDQRGTGGSGAVDCGTSDCAAALGPARPFMSTFETAADLEDLRVQLGVDQITPLGVSYGTAVADAYARLHPDHTAALILDSPVPVNDSGDGLNRESFAVLPRVLKDVCTGDCKRTVGAVPLKRAVHRLRRAGVSEELLVDALLSSDTQPVLRAELPAAIASLAHGDNAPLLHAISLWPEEDADVNSARLLATDCLEMTFPWAPDSPLAGRPVPSSFLTPNPYAPFSWRNGFTTSLAFVCADWPPTPRPAPLPAAAPQMPVLVISGRDDIRTPLESARQIAAAYPHATFLEVANVGHSVIRHDYSGCALDALIAFLRAEPVGSCAHVQPFIAPARYRPAELPVSHTLDAVYFTIEAAFRDRTAYRGWYDVGARERLPALRSGYTVVTARGVEFHTTEVIRGVRVSGKLSAHGGGTLTVSGPRARAGTVTLHGTHVSGTLGGKRIRR